YYFQNSKNEGTLFCVVTVATQLLEAVVIANAFFYTFSTIAQTLAGAIALLGAFVLYRMESLRQAIEEDSRSVIHWYNLQIDGYTDQGTHQQALRTLYDEQRYRDVHAFFASTTPPLNTNQATQA